MEVENVNYSDKAKYDLGLVERAVSGDQKADAELHSRYRDSIYFMLLKMVNNKSDAEDLKIFVVVFEVYCLAEFYRLQILCPLLYGGEKELVV